MTRDLEYAPSLNGHNCMIAHCRIMNSIFTSEASIEVSRKCYIGGSAIFQMKDEPKISPPPLSLKM